MPLDNTWSKNLPSLLIFTTSTITRTAGCASSAFCLPTPDITASLVHSIIAQIEYCYSLYVGLPTGCLRCPGRGPELCCNVQDMLHWFTSKQRIFHQIIAFIWWTSSHPTFMTSAALP